MNKKQVTGYPEWTPPRRGLLRSSEQLQVTTCWQKSILLFSLFIIHHSFCFSQEVLMDLTTNPVVVKKYNEVRNSTLRINPVKLDTVSLPFLDDFSKDDIYPDAFLWLDSNVFINRDYPIAPPTLGVATFDGVSKSGCPYDTLASANSSESADTLTSKPINLSSLPPDSSVIFSFFWQASSFLYGRGNDPENSDTLLLQFKNPLLADSIAWKTVWYKNGYNPVTPDTGFHLVIIPITDLSYLQNGFQFRFRNYATVSGNVDHWHIDYVYLDKNRSMTDTIFDDVAFVYNSRSLLKNYYAMPWEQYQASEMKSNLTFFIRNNDTVTKNVSFTDTIYNSALNPVASDSLNAGNIYSWSTNGYCNYAPFANPPISTTPPNYVFPILTQDTSFLLECVLTPPISDIDKWNDTLRFTQTFSNYYAYDDGTAEKGYGLNAAGGQIAYKFSLNQPDTLVAVQMLFNWIGPNVNQQQFKIRVWGDNGGVPSSAYIYEDTIITPNYEYVYHNDWGNLTNMFYPYLLKTKQVLSGTFYVGFVQYTNPSTTLLNLGLDQNTNSNSKMYYNVGSGWNQSALAGSWMIRPVFGTTKGLLTVHNEEPLTSSFTIYPNPTSGKFRIQSDNNSFLKSIEENYHLTVFSIDGQMVHEETISSFSSEIDISNLREGLYFVRVENKNGLALNQKFVLTK
ncbi:MAG: T9SS type A sorting domain-containing protein [Bacteroidetes bacterium]|nr:T9SS type A sorting domain-containing protein [Bacteroidota bacterium]